MVLVEENKQKRLKNKGHKSNGMLTKKTTCFAHAHAFNMLRGTRNKRKNVFEIF